MEIFERALEVTPGARDEMIESDAGGDIELADTVRGMLAADEGTGDLLDGGIENVAHLAFDFEAADATSLSPGDQVGDFEIIAELGRGGMGIVYAARDRTLGRVAALKLLPARATIDAAASERLVAEAQAASALDHPNVATIYQIGETSDHRRFIAMARYEGETLRERLARGPLSPREAFHIAKQVAAGLAAAHASGLVHRDVKPENIFVTRHGLVKLLDFGIATLAGSPRDGPTTRGTILYMSPEHARRETADARSDVWSLGVVLYEMLTGAPPYTGTTATEILARIADPAPVRMPPIVRRIPAVAGAALAKSLEKDPQRRYADASSMLAQLERVENQWSQPRRVRIGIAVAASVVLLAAVLVRARPVNPPPQPELELAVLPVVGNSSDTEATELTTALGAEIAARVVGLGRVRLVRVKGDTVANASSHPGLHFLRLRVERENNRPVVAITLERPGTEGVIWSERRTFDRRELRELGRDVVVGVLQGLGRPVTERERAIIGNGFPSSAEAYEEFLHANRLMSLRTPGALEQALVRYRRASQLDSMFAGALARQSYAYALLVDWGWKPSRAFPADPLAEGLHLADRATQLDSTSAEAWLARAYNLAMRDPHRFRGAAEAFQHAITLDPYNAEAFHQYGQTLMVLGRYSEAMAAYRRVLDLEPDRAMTLVPMAVIYKKQGRPADGLRLLDSAVSAAPRVAYARAIRSYHRAQLGQVEGARHDADTALALDSNFRIPALGALAKAEWLLGDTAAAKRHIADAERAIAVPGTPTPTEAYMISQALVTAGRFDRAIAHLRGARPRGAWLWFLFTNPDLERFRAMPEAAAILAEADPRTP